jgi:hypothetical protein
MDTTDCLGLPFPECDPPVTKDASDIAQFRDLAIATDTAVQTLANNITEFITDPDAVNMLGGITTAGQVIDHLYGGGALFDNSNMADNVADVIRIQRDGWYLIGGTVTAQPPAPTILALRVQCLKNGDPLGARQGNGFSVNGAVAADYVSWVDVQFLQAGDALTLRTQHTVSAATSITYNIRGWALRILTNV